MKKVYLLFIILITTQLSAQTIILTDSSHNSNEIMRFDQVGNQEILFQVCEVSNDQKCQEVGTILSDDLNEFISADKRKLRNSAIASVAALAFTGVGLYMGLVQENALALGATMMLAPFCQGIPFTLFLKNSDQHGLRKQTDTFLSELQSCSLNEKRSKEVYNFDLLKKYITKFVREV